MGFKYFSLAAATAGLVNPADNRAWNNDLRLSDFDYGMADGSEIILPVNVHDPTDTISGDMFNLMDDYISFLKSHHTNDFTYGAHHVGRAFPGYDYSPLSTDDKKGWNIIVSGGRLHVTWEGDFKACIRLANHIDIKDINGDSNKVCSFDAANEYCHRHGGQLFIPDEFYWNFAFNPMCNSVTDGAKNSFGANRFQATYSQVNYWLNLQAVEESSGQFQVKTTSDFHMFHQLDTANVWSGMLANGFHPSVSSANPHVSQNLLTDITATYPTNQFKDVARHALLGTQSFDDQDMVNHAEQMKDKLLNNNGEPFLNMHYISEQLEKGGLVSQTCLIIDCQAGLLRPKIQDTACDHNNVRPLCIIENIFDHFQTCPADLHQSSNGNESVQGPKIAHCGDNVKPFLVQNIFNYVGFYESVNGVQAERFFHAWNSGSGGAASVHNPIYILRRLYRRAVQEIDSAVTDAQMQDDFFSGNFQISALNADLPSTPVITFYTNCFGTYDASEGKWLLDIPTHADVNARTQKTICEFYGFRYDNPVANADNTLNRYHVNANNSISAMGNKWIDNCECECELSRTFTDINTVAKEVANADLPEENEVIVKQTTETFCCADGFRFEPLATSGYAYGVHTCDRCVTLTCRDEIAYDQPGHTTDFWRQSEATANTKRVWFTAGNQYHSDATIQGTCVPLTCDTNNYDPPGADLCVAAGVASQIASNGVYGQGYSADYPCDNSRCCGQIRDVCIRDSSWTRPAVGSADTCNPYIWSREGTCQPKYCTTSTTPFSRILNNLVQVNNGESYTIECNVGYEVYVNGVAQGSRQASTVCQIDDNNAAGTCAVSTVHDITCVPAVCKNQPASTCTFDASQTEWSLGSSVTCSCPSGYCGTQTSQCTINADGFTASWSSAIGSCALKTCAVTNIANADLVAAVTTVNNGGSFSHRCQSGFAMFLNGVKTADGKTGTTTCTFPNNNEECASSSLACCSHTPEILYECRPIQCDTDPCLTRPGFVAHGGVLGWALGDTLNCQCPNTERALIGDAVQDNGCPFICVEDATGNHSWRYVNENCGCKPPMCAKPCVIPHGDMKYRESLASSWIDHNRVEAAVGTWASYECHSGYDLVFSHNDEVATPDQCAMQCYNPVESSCIDEETNYNRLNPIAVMDPLNCYCRPRQCRALTDADLLSDHEWVDATEKSKDYWPIAGFNTIDIKCKDSRFPKNKGIGGGNNDILVCTDYDTWTTPGACVETACRVPRDVVGSYWAPGLNIDHTCMSRDSINVENPVYATDAANTIGYTNARATKAQADAKDQVYLAGPQVNVKNGAIYSFTCKKGWSPYFNFEAVVGGASAAAQPGSGFDCTCNNGIWDCNMHCRCEGLCV